MFKGGVTQAGASQPGASRTLATSFWREHDFIQALYLVRDHHVHHRLRGLAGPKTAPLGNKVAALGMLIASSRRSDPRRAARRRDRGADRGRVVLGTVIGIPAARQVKMTAMPQMVALFNGGAAGAWRDRVGGVRRRFPGRAASCGTRRPRSRRCSRRSSARSRSGLNIAFGKLQSSPGRPIRLPGQQIVNGVWRWWRRLGDRAGGPARTPRRSSSSGSSSRRRAGQPVVLRDRRRDMPVVDLAAERVHRACGRRPPASRSTPR